MKTPDNYKIKTAIISVSNKAGLPEFAQKLTDMGVKIYSTGGTKKLLAESGIHANSISDLTGFPEILGGRVKTLHPNVHAGLLADLGNPDHEAQLAEHGIGSVDLVVVNLYPFEQTLAKNGASHAELIENIDIGGPAMIRASAKNYRWTAVVVEPDDYARVAEALESTGGCVPEKLRAELAGAAYAHTAYYDSVIADYFRKYNEKPLLEEGAKEVKIALPMRSAQTLRYGENPHQKAMLFGKFNETFVKLHGKELSYNNIIDMDAAARLILEFEDEPAVAIIKHTNPCGAAIGEDIPAAFAKALATDTVSAFGGIICTSRPIDLATAEVMHGMFTELIIAPDFSEEALALLTKKRDRRLLKVDFPRLRASFGYELKSVAGGFLMQESDMDLAAGELKVVTKRAPTPEEIRSLLFGWKICKHVKSNAIVYTDAERTLGIGAGQMSRVDSSRIAVEKSKMMNLSLEGSTMASDAYFPFADGLLEAHKAGATAVIQPGGSVRDEEVIAAADEVGIAMVFTGMRHFRH
ncbi:MAG: bifunctional phosphoribosylaminoimidazolecarboxamide formyltransferase/IMP cyclohydrolase [Chloroflexota bacterium]